MQYIPPGFWPRLTTRILDDENLCFIFSKIFYVSEIVCTKNCGSKNKSFLIESHILNILNEIFNLFGGQFSTNVTNNNLIRNKEKEIVLNDNSKVLFKKISESKENINQFGTKLGFEWVLWRTGFEVLKKNEII